MTDRDGEDQAFVDAISEWPDINDGLTLAGFLLARITEDEAAARTAGSGPWRWEQGYGAMCNDPECPYGQLMQDKPEGLTMVMEVHGYDICDDSWNGAGHIARHDPARVLAECEAKRRIIDDHAPAPESGVGRELAFERIVRDGTVYGGGIVPACRRCVHAHCDMDCENEPYPCLTLRLLALPYADNPHYRDEWRP